MPQLAPMTIVAPGTLGLNKERASTLLDPQWATKALNMAFDRTGRLAARKGWTVYNSGGAAAVTLQRVHEVILQNGTTELIASGGAKVFRVPSSADLGSVANDITSSTAPSDGTWKFLNFNNKCIGVQAGEVMTVYTGTGDFTDITPSSGTLPTGGAACAAFGRLWVSTSTGQGIKYCALLDETDWGGTDTGLIDMSTVWTRGTDQVVAIESIGANLIVFGRHHIVIWTSSGGSEIGLIPTEIYVADVIEGTGTIARDSIQAIGEGDLLFLSRHGIQALSRVIAAKNNPIETLSKYNREYIQTFIAAEADYLNITSVHHPETGIYAIMFPSSSRTLVFDVRRILTDEAGDSFAPTTEWLHSPVLRDMVSTRAGDLRMALGTNVGTYTGNSDNNSAYDVQYDSGWLKVADEYENRLKILKEIRTLALVSGSPTALWRWAFDFGLDANQQSRSVAYEAGSGSEYGIAMYNVDEYAGGLEVFQRRIHGSEEGQYIKIGVTTSINNAQFVIQQLTLFTKLGRMV